MPDACAVQIRRAVDGVATYHNVLQCSSVDESNAVMAPIMLIKNMCIALAAAEVEYWVADSEADAAVAYTAQLRQWLVMSNDSDFHIYDVPGFVPLGQVWPSEGCFDYHVIRRTAVARAVGLEREQWLCLLASFCGNDYVSDSTLQVWHSTLGVASHIEVFQPVAAVISRLFRLEPQLSIRQAAERLCQLVSAQSGVDLERLRRCVNFSVAEYDTASRERVESFGNTNTTTTLTLRGSAWPSWLVRMLRNGSLGSAVLHATQLKWWCTPTVEQMLSPSAYSSSASLRRAVFSILHPAGGTATEFCRPSGDCGFRAQPFPFASAASAHLPAIDDVQAISIQSRQALLLRITGCLAPPEGLDASLRLGVIALVYLLQRSRAKRSADELQRMCLMVATLELSDSSGEAASLVQSCGARPTWWRSNDTFVAHSLSEWHATLATVDALNVVLGEPFAPIVPQNLFGGLAAHRIYAAASSAGSADEKVCLLQRQLIEACTLMSGLGSGDDVQIVAGYFTVGNTWEGTLVYDGEIDPSYSLVITSAPCNGKVGQGDHIAFGAAESVSVSIYERDGTFTVVIRDDESMLCGPLNIAQRRISGIAYSIDGNKKTIEGEFNMELCN